MQARLRDQTTADGTTCPPGGLRRASLFSQTPEEGRYGTFSCPSAETSLSCFVSMSWKPSDRNHWSNVLASTCERIENFFFLVGFFLNRSFLTQQARKAADPTDRSPENENIPLDTRSRKLFDFHPVRRKDRPEGAPPEAARIAVDRTPRGNNGGRHSRPRGSPYPVDCFRSHSFRSSQPGKRL